MEQNKKRVQETQNKNNEKTWHQSQVENGSFECSPRLEVTQIDSRGLAIAVIRLERRVNGGSQKVVYQEQEQQQQQHARADVTIPAFIIIPTSPRPLCEILFSACSSLTPKRHTLTLRAPASVHDVRVCAHNIQLAQKKKKEEMLAAAKRLEVSTQPSFQRKHAVRMNEYVCWRLLGGQPAYNVATCTPTGRSQEPGTQLFDFLTFQLQQQPLVLTRKNDTRSNTRKKGGLLPLNLLATKYTPTCVRLDICRSPPFPLICQGFWFLLHPLQ